MTEEEIIDEVRKWWAYREFIVTPINNTHNRIIHHVSKTGMKIYDECQHNVDASSEGECIFYASFPIKQLPSFYFEK
jgi:hypothetical protein